MEKLSIIFVLIAVSFFQRGNASIEEHQHINHTRFTQNRVFTDRDFSKLPEPLMLVDLIDLYGSGLSMEPSDFGVYPRAGYHRSDESKYYFGYYIWFKRSSSSDDVEVGFITRTFLDEIEDAEVFAPTSSQIVVWPCHFYGKMLKDVQKPLSRCSDQCRKGQQTEKGVERRK